jgi:hypothetical protein
MEAYNITFNKLNVYNVSLRYTQAGKQYNNADILWANTDKILAITRQPEKFEIGIDKRIHAD